MGIKWGKRNILVKDCQFPSFPPEKESAMQDTRSPRGE
jgi:hypothetical protein